MDRAWLHRKDSGATYPSDGMDTWLGCPVDLDLGVPDGSDCCALGGQMVHVEMHLCMNTKQGNLILSDLQYA